MQLFHRRTTNTSNLATSNGSSASSAPGTSNNLNNGTNTGNNYATNAQRENLQKANLAAAYAGLGRELSSARLRVVGNYTLGRVIGEGKPPSHSKYVL
jgi:hypothetical protein